MITHEFTLETLAEHWQKGEMTEKAVLYQTLMWMQSLVTNQALVERSLEGLKREVAEFQMQEAKPPFAIEEGAS